MTDEEWSKYLAATQKRLNGRRMTFMERVRHNHFMVHDYPVSWLAKASFAWRTTVREFLISRWLGNPFRRWYLAHLSWRWPISER